MTTETKKTKKTETPMLNIHDLEKATGKDGREIRRILRKEFGGGAGKEYAWKPGDDQFKSIVSRVKGGKSKAEAPTPAAPPVTAPKAPARAVKAKAPKAPAAKAVIAPKAAQPTTEPEKPITLPAA